jgi:hypothetical protein
MSSMRPLLVAALFSVAAVLAGCSESSGKGAAIGAAGGAGLGALGPGSILGNAAAGAAAGAAGGYVYDQVKKRD